MANLNTDSLNLYDLYAVNQIKERKLLQFETQDYSAYSHMKPDIYFSPYSGKVINRKYVTGSKTENLIPTPFTFTSTNMDSYNFKPGDKSINNVLSDFYKFYNDFALKNLDNINLPQNFDNTLLNYNKHTLMMPYNVSETDNSTKLFFSIPYRSKIFSNYLQNQDKTEFMIEELKDINKKDYAYTVLFFPSYDKDNNKSYGYLIGTLLVAYMLKNLPQNYDLYQNGFKGTKANVVCLVTPDTDDHIIKLLKLFYDDVVICPYISWSKEHLSNDITDFPEKFIHINDVSKGNIDKGHVYSKVFSKINIFNKNLLPYKKVILIDADLFPLGYYDSLFTLKTPAGCIEHRRLQIDELGINSWSFDRGQIVKHGEIIPKNLTDIENIYASDINASLLIIEPDNNTFKSMIDELQSPLEDWFSETKYHKGFWLGNDFYDFYFLPEQNYLTKRFSGTWTSVDMGFSSWLIDIDNSFGFTFAGFIVKPWGTQSSFQKYSINPYSTFSKINNKITQKSYGYQIMNHYIYKMLKQVNNNELFNLFDISFTDNPFDPWEPEYVLKNTTKIRDVKNIQKLSYDQKKLVYLLNNCQNIKKLLYFDFLIDNIGKKINNLEFTALSYHLVNILYNIANSEKIMIFPFGNTYLSVEKFKSFDITNSDSNSLIFITDNKSFKNNILTIIKKLLDFNLQIYVLSKFTNEFIQVLQDDNKPLYYFKDNTNKITFSEFEKYDFSSIKYFNVSYYSPTVEKIIYDHNITLTQDMYSLFKKYQTIKVPWINIYPLFKGLNKDLIYDDSIRFSQNTFYKRILWDDYAEKMTLHVIRKPIQIQAKAKYIAEFYGGIDRLNNYYTYDENGNADFRLDLTCDTNEDLLELLFTFVNNRITEKYNSTNINEYLLRL